jgi:hypothetical protein
MNTNKLRQAHEDFLAIAAAGGAAAGGAGPAVAGSLAGDDLSVLIHVLIVSGDELVVDEPRPIGGFVEAVGTVHLPVHGAQLRSLRA